MNDEVRILREVVVKVTQLLAGMGLKVTQRGTKAFVGTNRATHKPEVVNIPYLPDNASKELILAIQGFIDHEVAHILETDFSVHAAIDKAQRDFPHLRAIWNTLEDTFIERQMSRRFAGSGFNLQQLHRFFISDITTPVYTAALAKGDVDTAFSALFVPAFRAYSGQRLFQEFMEAGAFEAHPELGPKFKRLAPFVAEVAKLKSTWECFELAKRISEALKAPPPPPAPKMPAPPPPPPSSEDEEQPEEQPENEPQGGNGGEGDTPEDEGKGPAEEPKDEQSDAGKPGESDDAGEEDKDEDADASGDEAGGDEAPETEDDEPGEGAAGEGELEGQDDTGEPSDGAADDGDDADKGEEPASEDDGAGSPVEDGDDQEGDRGEEEGEVGASGASGEHDDEDDHGDDEPSETADADGEGGDGSDEADGEAADGEGDAAGGADAGEEDTAGDQGPVEQHDEDAEGEGNDDPNAGGPVLLVGGAVDYDDAIAAKIGEEARDMTASAAYRIYTKDFDVIEPFPTDMENYQDAWLTALDDRTRQSVGVMQKEIQRMMAARSQSVKVPGFRSGRLHTAGLHRLAAGDDRVFRRLHVNVSKDVAVGLLIDNSGSMEGIKVQTAMEAGYALSTTLERVGIQHEVLGFTTKWHPWGKEIKEAHEAAIAAGIPYTRYEPIYMPVYKGFDERLTSEIKRRFAAAPHQDFMGSNVDGESLEYAAYRLLRRKETRKVLLVLSDGNPVADGDVPALRKHLKETVKAVEARGIETVGIGILTDAPRHYFPKFALLNNAADLPKCVMGELKRILLS
ncbi:hypothetical protein ABID82_005099 [Methylobacterium sp. PvP062]|uniref:Cobalamin biosynthesis protein CobT VWA domain-containing protein n=1 Tax=Methylobacterium radiotolerans TaxID=31998 RepID=A0ABV2NU60_9HYPH|nr:MULTISPECIES: hypothetical protein [unclassified Methylobacterium]MBP2498413.1 hypothetical protein [Methylobacterium sp. PvP105]MBP2505592.1 hypothetical protein [Methylobacterium sp. PvP109]